CRACEQVTYGCSHGAALRLAQSDRKRQASALPVSSALLRSLVAPSVFCFAWQLILQQPVAAKFSPLERHPHRPHPYFW
ncbi:hypothetical protein, partial [Xanthomonas citri]